METETINGLLAIIFWLGIMGILIKTQYDDLDPF